MDTLKVRSKKGENHRLINHAKRWPTKRTSFMAQLKQFLFTVVQWGKQSLRHLHENDNFRPLPYSVVQQCISVKPKQWAVQLWVFRTVCTQSSCQEWLVLDKRTLLAAYFEVCSLNKILSLEACLKNRIVLRFLKQFWLSFCVWDINIGVSISLGFIHRSSIRL